jgi:hypothetical protein
MQDTRQDGIRFCGYRLGDCLKKSCAPRFEDAQYTYVPDADPAGP